MAARENQGIQIALIIFVILTIILIVTTYLFFSSYQKEKEANKALAADNSSKTSAATEALNESGTLKSIIGAALTDRAADVEAKAKKDMETFGKGIPDAKGNYRFLAEQLYSQLNTANSKNVELTDQKKDLETKLKANEEAKQAEFAKYSEKYEEAAKDLQDERAKFGKQLEENIAEKNDLKKKFDTKRGENEELTKQSSAQIAELKNDQTKLRGTLERINDEKQRNEKANEVPDGKVSWINQVSRTVWINLGSDDGLRRQTSFSVFDRDDTNPIEAESKGKIEVVRLKDRHLAEARIVEDDLSNPIMPGDQIFSPTWEPGRAEHFALAGFIDIDGDGESDRQRVRDLISLNGGVIDAEATEDGKNTGKVTINTKYLILGEAPKETQEGKINAYSEIFDEAKTYGVKTMPVAEFLDHMGYQIEDRTTLLGKNARAGDFKPRLPEGVQRVVPGGLDKERRKPVVIDKNNLK